MEVLTSIMVSTKILLPCLHVISYVMPVGFTNVRNGNNVFPRPSPPSVINVIIIVSDSPGNMDRNAKSPPR